MNYLIALGLCVAAACVEGLCAGRDPMAQLKATRQPVWSPPNWVWVLIGVAWYGISYTALARLLPLWPASRLAVVLVCAMMLANASANLLQFRMKRLDLAFYFLFPYWLLLAAFLWSVAPLDRLACGLFSVYAVYQLYAGAWAYQLWKLNKADM